MQKTMKMVPVPMSTSFSMRRSDRTSFENTSKYYVSIFIKHSKHTRRKKTLHVFSPPDDICHKPDLRRKRKIIDVKPTNRIKKESGKRFLSHITGSVFFEIVSRHSWFCDAYLVADFGP